MEYGYIRVSTREQNEDRQRIALTEVGVRNIILDKCSGKDFDRPGYRRLCREFLPYKILEILLLLAILLLYIL